MTTSEWTAVWNRLRLQFRVNADTNPDDVSAEWFAHVRHWHVDAVERGVTELIGGAKDTFLPGVGKLKELIQSRIDRYDTHRQACPTCDGSTWIEAWPVMWGGRLYEMMARCPDCGVPAPPMKKPHGNARPATKAEYDDWKARTFARDTMPDWAKAKKPYSREESAERLVQLREMFDRLSGKLFSERDIV